MKTLGIMMSLLFGMLLLPSAQGQVCNNDNDYYYENSDYHKKKNVRHYNSRTYYKNDKLSIRSFERRIIKGVRSGELTKRETRKLKSELNKLIHYENRIFADHRLTRKERKRLDHKKLKLDKMIYDKKHNHNSRY